MLMRQAKRFKRAAVCVVLTVALLLGGQTAALAAAVYESEPNNSVATADPVAVGDAIYGMINTAGDPDFYSFTVPSARTVTVAFSSPDRSPNTFGVVVLDMTGGGSVLNFNSVNGNYNSGTFNALPGRDYRVMVTAGSASLYYYTLNLY